MKQFTIHGEQETKKFAAEYASKLVGGEVVELIGDLGAGKTTFVRGVVEAFGSEARVKSPTFTIMNEYPVGGEIVKRIVHLDLYRFTSPDEIAALQLEDYIRPDTVVFVEWPNVFDVPIFENAKRIEFIHVDEEARKVIVS